MNPDVTHVHKRGTWQLCHVRRLAFPLNISFYLMQHTPLWRSKFRILRIKKTRTKIGTLRISHTSLKLHRDIPSGSFTESDLRKIRAITDKVWWLSRAYKCSPRRGFRGFAFVCICILLRCKLKSPQNGNLKKRIIHLSRNITHDLYDLYFRKGVLNTNEHSQCEGQKQHQYKWTIGF